MRTALKLLLIAATALAALAFTATNASAQLSVENEATGNDCPAITSPPTVTGGCHVEFEAEEDVPLYVHITGIGEFPQSNCEVFLEGRIGPDGEGYITEANLTTPHDTNIANCTREPCMTDTAMDPWPIHINEDAPGEEEVTVTFCLSQNGQMGTKTPCTLHLPLTQDGHHQEIVATDDDLCAQIPASIVGHFLSHESETGTEEIVIHHD